MEVKISIIIPVYNVEKYLRECLDSILNQTFQDFEIICVDDGSTDQSLAILREYEQKDKRFKIISQNNKGVSTARNVGIQHAQGEYIMFVDSDDWLADNAFERVYFTAQSRNCDMLLFSSKKVSKVSCTNDGRLLDLYLEIKNGSTDFKTSYENLLIAPNNVCGKLYKSSFIRECNLKFPINLQSGEDKIFYIDACIHAKSICALFEHLYYYRDTENSLTKNPKTVIPHLYTMHLALKKMLKSYNLTNYEHIYALCLNWSINILLWQWKCIHNYYVRNKNISYLYKFAIEYIKMPAKYKDRITKSNELIKAIVDYKILFLQKIFEPLFELEFRRNKIVFYLFEKQAICFSTNKIIDFILNFRYLKHLWKLRIKSRFKKIKVGFWVTEVEKWSSNSSLYQALSNSSNFEPFVILANFKNFESGLSSQEHMLKKVDFFENRDIRYKLVYDLKCEKHLEIKTVKPDIVFYQQPWQIPVNQSVKKVSKTSLICYVPYCYYSLNSYMNYLFGFHGKLWKYFVESDLHKKEYEQKFNAKNCVAIGSCKLDSYKNLDTSKINQIWKTVDKKRIIYAPHLSFEQENLDYSTATFDKNGDFILELAKSHPEFEWIFRPHPVFRDRVLKYNIRTLEEIENYYKEWKKIGSIYTDGNYYEMFAGSDCLITDCISFLSEYLPSGKPVIHLRKDNQKGSFNNLLKTITDDYYKIYDNETLAKVFEEVVINGNDYLKNKRIENIKLLMIDENKTTGEKIKEYLEKELWLRR